MAIITTDSKNYADIAAAIRAKSGSTAKYKPNEMAAAISAIEGGGSSGGSGDLYPKTLEDARNLKVPTAEEIYTQYRPKEWPVLPDPDVNQEIYLCRTIEVSGMYYFPILSNIGTHKIGYINKGGNFVEVLGYNGTTTTFGVQTQPKSEVSDEISEYYVLIYEGDRIPNGIANNTQTQQVSYAFLEAKINVTGKSYVLGSYYYDNSQYSRFNWWSLQFVKFYGKAADNINVNGLFYNMISLRAFMFDNEENNFLIHNNSAALKYVFYYCRSLLCPIEINNDNNLGNNLNYVIYQTNCPKITLHTPNTEKTSTGDIIGYVTGLKWIDAAIHKCNANYLFSNCNEEAIIYCKAVVPGNSDINYRWIYAMFSEVFIGDGGATSSMSVPKGEMHILPETVMSSIAWGAVASNSRYLNNTDIDVFVEELPSMNEARTFNLAQWRYPLQITDELIAKATEKGYTVALS